MQDCQGGKAGSVRRQSLWDQYLLKLGESLAHLFSLIGIAIWVSSARSPRVRAHSCTDFCPSNPNALTALSARARRLLFWIS